MEKIKHSIMKQNILVILSKFGTKLSLSKRFWDDSSQFQTIQFDYAEN